MFNSINNIPVTLHLIDSPRRDLENKLVLASHLANHGIASIIGIQTFIKHIHSGSKGCLWLGRLCSNDGNHPVDKNLRRIMQENNTRLFYLHDEGAFYFKGFYENVVLRTHPVDLVNEKQTEKIFFWGEKQKKIYAKHISPAKYSLLSTVGAPRFDLCKKKYAKLDQEKVSYLHSKYGDFVLFCTQFPWFNHAPDVLSPFEKRSLELAQYGFSSKAEARNHVFDMWQKVGNGFIAFVKLIQEAAFAHPDQQFVVRPHPGENHNFYKNSFSDFDNITVDSGGDLRPVLRAAKLLIHSECTSGFEALLSGKPAINYTPRNSHPKLAIEGLKTLSPVATTQEEALNAIADVLEGRSTGHSTVPSSFNRIIANIECDSIPLIAEHLRKFCSENNWSSSFGAAPIKQQVIHSLVSAKKRGKFLLKGKGPLGKNVPLNSFEVEKLFENIQRIVGEQGKLISVAHDHVVVSP
jgi:surface carbohydrate biosynthesis protein